MAERWVADSPLKIKNAASAETHNICGLSVIGNTAVSKTARCGFESQQVMPILRGRLVIVGGRRWYVKRGSSPQARRFDS